jgi:hypothetical protein
VSWQRALVSVPVFLVLLVSPGPADEPAGQEDKQVVDTKAARKPPAAAIDFRKELNLPFASLGTLGARIDSARKAPDPVALASAASELAVAEKVAGKKASLTSDTLLRESQELAKLRRQEGELQAVLHTTQQLTQEEAAVSDLKMAVANAQKQAKEESEALKRGDNPKTTPHRITIHNQSGQWADVYVNGHYQLRVPPYQSRSFLIEHKYNPTILTAYGNEDLASWGPRYIWGKFKDYTWNLG